MAKRITKIENWQDVSEVRLFAAQPSSSISTPNVAGAIGLVDDRIEFNFPQTVTMSKEQAALICAHLITLITR